MWERERECICERGGPCVEWSWGVVSRRAAIHGVANSRSRLRRYKLNWRTTQTKWNIKWVYHQHNSLLWGLKLKNKHFLWYTRLFFVAGDFHLELSKMQIEMGMLSGMHQAWTSFPAVGFNLCFHYLSLPLHLSLKEQLTFTVGLWFTMKQFFICGFLVLNKICLLLCLHAAKVPELMMCFCLRKLCHFDSSSK